MKTSRDRPARLLLGARWLFVLGILVPSRAAAPLAADCFYCTRDAGLTSRMIEIGTLKRATVYLLRNQYFPGRCIVAFNQHRRELYELTPVERAEYMNDVAAVAQAIADVFHPDKINYGIFGDEVSHVHVHLAPKYRGTPAWGKTFTTAEDASPLRLSDGEYAERIDNLRHELRKLMPGEFAEGSSKESKADQTPSPTNHAKPRE